MSAPEPERPMLGIELSFGTELEDDEVAEAAQRLRRELLELDLETVELARAGEPPPGTRSAELMGLGMLVVTIAKSEVLSDVVSAVRAWMAARHHGGTARLVLDGDVLELTGVSSEEQRRLADAWLRRHQVR